MVEDLEVDTPASRQGAVLTPLGKNKLAVNQMGSFRKAKVRKNSTQAAFHHSRKLSAVDKTLKSVFEQADKATRQIADRKDGKGNFVIDKFTAGYVISQLNEKTFAVLE
jgi:hypothetical protein